MTGIEWTDKTWNPVTGCDKVSPGCDHCYAETLAKRLQAMGNPRYTDGFALTLHPDKIHDPMRWRKPARIFVNSMSDLLHRDVPDAFLLDVFRTMSDTPRHEYHVLTKRAGRWRSVSQLVTEGLGVWPSNVFPGVSVENYAALPRLRRLCWAGDQTTIRMVSIEPLLESIGPPEELAHRLRSTGIGWVISGGEAGFKARPAELDWFREVRDACKIAAIPFFHKQHGGRGVSKTVKRGGGLALLDGRLHHERPIKPEPRRGAATLPLWCSPSDSQ